jgi:uncharacterized membrane protein
MNETENNLPEPAAGSSKLPFLAAAVATVGILDSVYLTFKHYAEETVPCGITGGCEVVLTSSYSQIAGVPLAVFGAVAYFTAFTLAILAAYGNKLTWKLFGAQATLMALFSVFLTYLQAFVISNSQVPFAERFCQFCLVSAATSITLFLIALFSRFWRT